MSFAEYCEAMDLYYAPLAGFGINEVSDKKRMWLIGKGKKANFTLYQSY